VKEENPTNTVKNPKAVEYTQKYLAIYADRNDVSIEDTSCANPKVLACLNVTQEYCLNIAKVAHYKCYDKLIESYGDEVDLDDSFQKGRYQGCYAVAFYLQSPSGYQQSMNCMK
jgi:hypothetical protein